MESEQKNQEKVEAQKQELVKYTEVSKLSICHKYIFLFKWSKHLVIPKIMKWAALHDLW